MRFKTLILLAVVAAIGGCAKAAQPTPKTDEEKALYALGVILTRDVQTFNFTDQELAMLQAGIADGARGKSTLDDKALQELLPKLQELHTARLAEGTKKEKEAGATYLATAATEKDATKTASGLVFRNVQAGTGASPTADDMVKVHYTGKFIDGKVFDSSVERNEPATFPLSTCSARAP